MKDLKSAMSTKVYWKARKLIQSIGFRCKSLLYTYMDTGARQDHDYIYMKNTPQAQKAYEMVVAFLARNSKNPKE